MFEDGTHRFVRAVGEVDVERAQVVPEALAQLSAVRLLGHVAQRNMPVLNSVVGERSHALQIDFVAGAEVKLGAEVERAQSADIAEGERFEGVAAEDAAPGDVIAVLSVVAAEVTEVACARERDVPTVVGGRGKDERL